MKFTRPTFVVDELKTRNNIRKMALKASLSGVIFRPHFKTHQSAEIAAWFRQEGVDKITVSSVSMAYYFARAGWKDILIAFPVNLREIDAINQLGREVKLSLLLDSVTVLQMLLKKLNFNAGIYLKIDTGFHRMGLEFNDPEIGQIVGILTKSKFTFQGFLSHFGHAYNSSGKENLVKIYHDGTEQLQYLQSKFQNEFPEALISVGDTPCCSILERFEGVHEIRPGNFVFYDWMQRELGSCRNRDIAVAVACPVVAKYPLRNEIIIYGGAIHLSKEFLTLHTEQPHYGAVAEMSPEGWGNPIDNVYVTRLSQEHGVISCPNKIMDRIKIGQLIGILPVHSCLTANLYNCYHDLRGNTIENIHSAGLRG